MREAACHSTWTLQALCPVSSSDHLTAAALLLGGQGGVGTRPARMWLFRAQLLLAPTGRAELALKLACSLHVSNAVILSQHPETSVKGSSLSPRCSLGRHCTWQIMKLVQHLVAVYIWDRVTEFFP